ncbi:hypothetical protein HFP57_12955 [Parasphingopyxis algicola]|uniref:hypothetical protein n=1 Tax=Parasphingopyxis algicola TaxID=2026624 RepID=UPI0015A2D6A4|nr:hypothetical protein [Parasphingopyxis algicola]QLC25840.1 hypothetical protein HFP57_12955 [Parasphingopyxis algicola]
MQIEIDFDVFKALTALRQTEADSYNSVIRRLLELPDQAASVSDQPNALAQFAKRRGVLEGVGKNALLDTLGGIWFGSTHFPDGTKFRATYKGRTYFAEIRDGKWIDEDGLVRTSPSDAASAISNTNVNGWRFWYVLMPGTSEWRKMDEFKSS